MNDAIEQFRSAIRSAGLEPPETVEPDGQLHRFPTNGKRGDDSGWYVLYADNLPAGAFGCWRNDISETWHADAGRKLTPAEREAHRARVEAVRRAREEEDAKRQAEARTRAEAIWSAAQP